MNATLEASMKSITEALEASRQAGVAWAHYQSAWAEAQREAPPGRAGAYENEQSLRLRSDWEAAAEAASIAEAALRLMFI